MVSTEQLKSASSFLIRHACRGLYERGVRLSNRFWDSQQTRAATPAPAPEPAAAEASPPPPPSSPGFETGSIVPPARISRRAAERAKKPVKNDFVRHILRMLVDAGGTCHRKQLLDSVFTTFRTLWSEVAPEHSDGSFRKAITWQCRDLFSAEWMTRENQGRNSPEVWHITDLGRRSLKTDSSAGSLILRAHREAEHNKRILRIGNQRNSVGQYVSKAAATPTAQDTSPPVAPVAAPPEDAGRSAFNWEDQDGEF